MGIASALLRAANHGSNKTIVLLFNGLTHFNAAVSCQQVAHRGCGPLAIVRGANVAFGKSRGNLAQGQSLGLQSAGNRTDRGCELIGFLLAGFHANGGRDFRAASPATELDTTNARRSQGGFGALRDETGFQLGDGGHLRQHELANRPSRQCWQVAEHDAIRAAAFDHGQQKACIARQAVDLRDHQGRPRRGQRGSVAPGRLT